MKLNENYSFWRGKKKKKFEGKKKECDSKRKFKRKVFFILARG